MKARPILFQSDMVRAILDGRKTQTRRVVKPQPQGFDAHKMDWGCPYGQPGDLLWVRETVWIESDGTPVYRADGEFLDGWTQRGLRWRPSIHMPRWASRLTLRVTGVRVQRLQEISCADAACEGMGFHGCMGIPGDKEWLRMHFQQLWEDINGVESWGANPWVWVIEFEPTRANVDEVLEAAA